MPAAGCCGDDVSDAVALGVGVGRLDRSDGDVQRLDVRRAESSRHDRQHTAAAPDVEHGRIRPQHLLEQTQAEGGRRVVAEAEGRARIDVHAQHVGTGVDVLPRRHDHQLGVDP